jgi:hypothetical protein
MSPKARGRECLSIAGRTVLICFAVGAVVACQPRVALEAPKEPITINLNIKLDAEVRVKLEERAKQDIQANPGIF